jgi:hypothetical protein
METISKKRTIKPDYDYPFLIISSIGIEVLQVHILNTAYFEESHTTLSGAIGAAG